MTDYTVMTHPLIQHKISKLRDKNTGTAEFRALVEEIAMLMGYEALKDLPTEDVCIETPIEECMTPVIAGRNLATALRLCSSAQGVRSSCQCRFLRRLQTG